MATDDLDEFLNGLDAKQRRAVADRLTRFPDYRAATYQVGYDDGAAHYLNRTAVRLCDYGVIFEDHANTSQYGKKYVLIPWQRINYVAIDTGSAYLSELLD